MVFMLVSSVAVVLENIRPYLYKLLIDRATTGQIDGLLPILTIYGGSWIVSDVLTSLANYLGDRVSVPASIDARIAVFRKVSDLDFAYHVNKNTGSLISAFKRGDNAFFSLYHTIYREILPIIISICVMFYFFGGVSFRFVLLLIGLLAINGVVAAVLVKKNLKKRAEFNDCEDEIASIITDNLINYETVKFFAQEEAEEKRLKQSFVVWKQKLYSYLDTFRVIDLVIGSSSLLMMIVIMALMVTELRQNQMTIGDFTMVTTFMGGFYYRFFGLVWNIRGIAKDYSDIEKYFSILDEEALVVDGKERFITNKAVGRIEFKDVCFSYPKNSQRVLDKVSLVIEPGESVAFVGKSGAGKTTLVKLLLRFYDVNSGQIFVDNQDISLTSKSALRSIMGVVPQEPVLFNNTIEFNIKYGSQFVSRSEVIRVAKMAHMDSFIRSLPLGYKTMVGERGVKLSGGQKQRLAIARALLVKPKILIFDEATSNLDSESESKVQDALWETAKNRTTLIIAHRFSTIKRADKILVLDKGKLAEMGKHDDLIKNGGLYYKLWSMQFTKGGDETEASGQGLLDNQ